MDWRIGPCVVSSIGSIVSVSHWIKYHWLSFMDQKIFQTFEEYLIVRVKSGRHLTEDSVRYSFFAALIDASFCQQHELILELPHPNIPKAEIDTFISAPNCQAYLEFKYHRQNDSASPKPQKAGSLFKDFNRLSAIENSAEKYLVYFTDKEMAAYFNKNQRQYGDFWLLSEGASFDFNDAYVAETSATFKNACGKVSNCRIEVIFSSQLKTSHEIRIFRTTSNVN